MISRLWTAAKIVAFSTLLTVTAFFLFLLFVPKYVPYTGPVAAPEGRSPPNSCLGKRIIWNSGGEADAETEAICLGWLQGRTRSSIFEDWIKELRYRWRR